MIAVKIEGATHVFGAPEGQPDVYNLHVKVVEDTKGRPYCVSRWEPTPDELNVLNMGGTVELWVMGNQPPVALSVAPHSSTIENES